MGTASLASVEQWKTPPVSPAATNTDARPAAIAKPVTPASFPVCTPALTLLYLEAMSRSFTWPTLPRRERGRLPAEMRKACWSSRTEPRLGTSQTKRFPS